MNADGVMDNIRDAFERSGVTLNELGQGLGYHSPTAKKCPVLTIASHVKPAHFDSASSRRDAERPDKRSREVITRQSLKLVPFDDVTAAI